MAIVALLVSVLLPVLTKARGAAEDTQCKAHQSQIYKAQYAYSNDYGAFAATWSEDDPSSWRFRLIKYVRAVDNTPEASIFQCPSVEPAEFEAQPRDAEAGMFPASMAINGCMQFEQWSYRPEAPPAPARTIALGDQAVDVLDALLTHDAFGVWTNGSMTNWYRADNHDPRRGYRHNEASHANVALMDGHVEPLGETELVRESGWWYWWDALAGDTAVASDAPDAGTPWTMPPRTIPSPTPQPPSGSPKGGSPTGPLTAPCGCPL